MSDWAALKNLAHDLTLLVVDDDPDVLQQLQQLLEQVFDRVFTATNGEEAWAVYQQQQADTGLDLVISDIRMPKKDGLELAQAIRDQDADIKILLVSAYNETRYFIQALDLGVDGFLVKPLQTQSLAQTLLKTCRLIQDRKLRLAYRHRLEEEHRLVADLLQSMLQHQSLNDPAVEWHLQPSERIGGDLIAVKRHAPSGHLYAFLADSTGHGLPAAAHLLPLYRIFHAMARKGYDLSSILLEMNQALCDFCPDDRFVAAILIKLDFRDGLLEIWNGGNPAALLLDQTGQVRTVFKSQHLPLGILDEGFDCSCQRYFCKPGDRLLAFSDGILDAENAAGERWGQERLLATYQQASDPQRLKAVIQALEDFVGQTQAGDDVSLLQLKLNTERV